MTIFIGCAGWSIPSVSRDQFPEEGSQLERYATRFHCVEINSSFYRPHQHKTYERWRNSTSDEFRFSVKLPRQMTHDKRLVGVEQLLDEFLEGVSGLGEKLGVILVQLPPSLSFDSAIARPFFSRLTQHAKFDVVCEPRHRSWFTDEASRFLVDLSIAQVVADPPAVTGVVLPTHVSRTDRIAYWRLHGSPQIYHSIYSPDALANISQSLLSSHQAGRNVWCIFDNTAIGHATENAFELQRLLM